MKDVKLFFMNSCPYCQKVIRFIEKNNILVDRMEIAIPTNKEMLIELGGHDQVPALLVDEKMIYESDDIIKFLAEKFDVEYTEEDLKTDANYCPIL